MKLKAVDLAEKSNSAASHKFRVSKKLVQDWQKQSDKKKIYQRQNVPIVCVIFYIKINSKRSKKYGSKDLPCY